MKELKLVKTYHAGDFKKGKTYNTSREWEMFFAMSHEFGDKFEDGRVMGIVYFKGGKTQTMGAINMNAGVCDDCTITREDVKKIEIYEVI